MPGPIGPRAVFPLDGKAKKRTAGEESNRPGCFIDFVQPTERAILFKYASA